MHFRCFLLLCIYPSARFLALQGLQGEIKHLYRSFAFLSSKMVIENGGILVCKTKHLVLAGGGKVRNCLGFLPVSTDFVVHNVRI